MNSPQQQAACFGKDPLTRQQAMAIQGRPNFGGRAYQCTFCGSWHVGHASRMPQRWKGAR
jgi:hypothetical protein